MRRPAHILPSTDVIAASIDVTRLNAPLAYITILSYLGL